jgi:hypothetical protein
VIHGIGDVEVARFELKLQKWRIRTTAATGMLKSFFVLLKNEKFKAAFDYID